MCMAKHIHHGILNSCHTGSEGTLGGQRYCIDRQRVTPVTSTGNYSSSDQRHDGNEGQMQLFVDAVSAHKGRVYRSSDRRGYGRGVNFE